MNNPIRLIDPNGKESEDPQKKSTYTYNGKQSHTVSQTTTNVTHTQDKKGNWTRTTATSTTSLSFKTSTNKDGSVKTTYTGGSIKSSVSTIKETKRDDGQFATVRGAQSQLQASSSQTLGSQAASALGAGEGRMGDLMNGVTGWFNRNGADKNPFMSPMESPLSPLAGASLTAVGEAVKLAGEHHAPGLFGGGSIKGGGLGNAILGLIPAALDAHDASNSEIHAGKTMGIHEKEKD